MNYDELKLGIESGNIQPYQLYNLDIEYPQFYAVNHYQKNSADSVDMNQYLSKIFLDIEVYSENKFEIDSMDSGGFPISAITLYSSETKTLYAYYLLIKKNIEQWNNFEDAMSYLRKELITNGYITDDIQIEIKTYTNDLPLIQDAWAKIHELDPSVITGWNSDLFDLPYIYYRLKNIYNNDISTISKILSKFGTIKIAKGRNGARLDLIEYINTDLLYIFRGREELGGGLGFGYKLASYSLDFASENILGVKKIKYKENNLTIDEFYESDCVNFLLYNIVDVCLTVNIDKKLKLIDQLNTYRRLMKAPLGISLRGPTVLFDTMVYNQLRDSKNYVRFGINDETSISISEEEINKIIKPLSKRGIKWDCKEITERTFLKISRKFEGAYVKDSPGKVVDSRDGLIIDLDYEALYPSMIKMFNVGFDTYYGRIIDPYTTSKVIELIDKLLKKRDENLIKTLHSNFLELIVKKISSEDTNVQNMNDSIQHTYYVLSYLFSKIINSGVNSIKEIFNPKSYNSYILLKKYFIPFINIVDEIHDLSTEYNIFCYDYLLNGEINHKSIYVVENINQSDIKVTQLLAENLESYLKKNNLILTLTGCLFYTHEKKTSMFYSWLNTMASLRKDYIKKRDLSEFNSGDYKFYDLKQSSTKVAMNTSYGLYGQSTFRYSNNWLAKTITTQGRLALKVSQELAEVYLKDFSK